MRTRLSKYRNQSTTFIAAVGRRGTIQRSTSPFHETVCLEFLTAGNQLVSDHLWVKLTEELSQRFPQYGDVIRFRARVQPYSKGYAGNRIPSQVDYRLVDLHDVEVIDRLDSDLSDRISDVTTTKSK
jgi:hypothetical protein